MRRLPEFVQRRQRDILADRHGEHQTFALSILGNEADARANRIQRMADFHPFAVYIDFAGILLIHAENGARGFGSARAHQTGDAQNFAAAHGKRYVLHLLARVNVFHAQAFPARLQMNLREFFLQFAPHHVADDFIQIGVRHVQNGHVAAVAHDRRAVADLHDLLQTMRDINDGNAARFQHTDRIEQRFDFTIGQRRGGFIHHQHLGIDGKCLGDLHHLLVRHAQIAHQRAGADFHAQIIQYLLRIGVHTLPIHHEAVFHDLPPHEYVFRHGQLFRQVQLLIDDGNAHPLRIVRRGDFHFPAVKQDFAFVLLICARKHLHQRGFARAVFAEQRVHLALFHGEIYVIQRQNAREFFNDALHLQKFCHGTLSHPFNISIVKTAAAMRAAAVGLPRS